MFTRKHYEAIAKAVRNAQVSYDFDNAHATLGANALLDSLCVIFSADNQNFDADHFRTACVSK